MTLARSCDYTTYTDFGIVTRDFIKVSTGRSFQMQSNHFKLNFFIGKASLQMVKQGRQNGFHGPGQLDLCPTFSETSGLVIDLNAGLKNLKLAK